MSGNCTEGHALSCSLEDLCRSIEFCIQTKRDGCRSCHRMESRRCDGCIKLPDALQDT